MGKLLHLGFMLCGLLLSVSAYALPDWYTRANFTVKVGETLPDGSFNNEPRWTVDATTQREVIVASSDANAGDTWDCQLFVQLPEPLNEGDKVTIRMKVRADNVQGACGSILNVEPGVYVDWHGMDSIYFSSKWTDYVGTIEITNNMLLSGIQPKTIAFMLCEPYTANNFYFDQISVAVDKAPAVDDWYKYARFSLKEGERGADGGWVLSAPESYNEPDGNACFRIYVPACVKSRDDKMLFITLPEPAEEGDVVSLEMKLRADAYISNAYIESHHMPGEPITGITGGEFNFEQQWTAFDKTWTVGENLLQSQSTTAPSMASSMQTFAIALGEYNMNEYYVYVDDVYVTIKKHPWINIITNSDMEDIDQMDNFLMKEGANAQIVPATNQKGSASVHAEAAVDSFYTQFIVNLPYNIPKGVAYRLSFKGVASVLPESCIAMVSYNDKMEGNGWVNVFPPFSNRVWQTFTDERTVNDWVAGSENRGMRNIVFNLAQKNENVDFLFDDVVFEIDESMIEPLRNRTEMMDLIKEAEAAIGEGKVPEGSEQLTMLQGAIRWGKGLVSDTDYEMQKWSYAWTAQEIRRILNELEQQPAPVDDPEFTAGTADNWYTQGTLTIKVDDTPKGGTRQFIAEPRWVKDPLDKKFENNVIVVTTPDNAQNAWDSQIFFTAPEAFEVGDKVTLRMKVRADRPRNDVQSHTHGQPGEYRHWMFFNEPVIFTTEWRTFESTAEVTEDMLYTGKAQTVALMLAEVGEEANNFFFDDVELTVTKVPANEGEAKNQLADLIDRVGKLSTKYKIERLKRALAEALKSARFHQRRSGIGVKPYRDVMSVLEKAARDIKRFADTNTDGHVSVTDVIALIKHIVDKDPEGFSLLGADVNDDGKFTVTDAIYILNLILNEDGAASAPARPEMDEVEESPIPQ